MTQRAAVQCLAQVYSPREAISFHWLQPPQHLRLQHPQLLPGWLSGSVVLAHRVSVVMSRPQVLLVALVCFSFARALRLDERLCVTAAESFGTLSYSLPAALTNELQHGKHIWRLETGNCLNDPAYSTEIILEREFALRNISSSENATFFFIAHYSTCVFNNCLVWIGLDWFTCGELAATYLSRIVNYVRLTWPYFNASAGSDHITAHSQDVARAIFGTSAVARSLFDVLENVVSLQNLGYVNNGGRWPHENRKANEYGQDLPRQHVVTLPAVNGAERTEVLVPQLARPFKRAAERRLLLQFRGGVGTGNGTDDLYSRGLRHNLYTSLNKTRRADVGLSIHNDRLPSVQLYWDEMADSVFCLYPEGYQVWSGRLPSLLASGCAPVLIVDGAVLPFESTIDWRRFSIKVSRPRAMDGDHILRIVDAVPRLKANMMLQQLHRLRYSFDYALDGKSGAFCHILSDLRRFIPPFTHFAWRELNIPEGVR